MLGLCFRSDRPENYKVAFIGSAGVPNRYGGFESFLEHCGPEIAKIFRACTITCDGRLYEDRAPFFLGMRRRFLGVPANGNWSVLHDLVAFLCVFGGASHIIVLGVSAGPWFPLFRLLCFLGGRRLIVNIDGVEWRRGKFGFVKRSILRVFDWLAQFSADSIVYDSPALEGFVAPRFRNKAVCVAYSGDQVKRLPGVARIPMSSLTICRIEPENNIELIICGILASQVRVGYIVGNWSASKYGEALRLKYGHENRLKLLNPVYDADRLAELREQCDFYIHGHSVGGTNPSLVEMLYYDCNILCFDCAFNRATAGSAAEYFRDAAQLASLLSLDVHVRTDRSELRGKYSRGSIAEQYRRAIVGH